MADWRRVGGIRRLVWATSGRPQVTQRAQDRVQKGDLLVLASGMPEVPAGRPLKLADLPAGTGVQVFPQGKTDNQNALIQLVRKR